MHELLIFLPPRARSSDEARGALDASHPDIETAAPARRIPGRGHYSEAARRERLVWLRRETGHPLSSLESTRLDPERLRGNVENLVGAVEVPVGLAGPLLVRGQHARGWFHAPLATTEGALVASVARGCLALSHAGAVTARVLSRRMTRVPVFAFADGEAAAVFADWVPSKTDELRHEISRVSHHARLIAVEPLVTGRCVYVRFSYETGEAAGQNMTTSATWRACQWLLRQAEAEIDTPVRDFLIESNMSGDKKVTVGSMIGGRGMRVSASAVVRRDVVAHVLDSTPEELVRLHRLALVGGIQAGAHGASINAANVVAGMFTATGQDIACVHESSVAVFEMEVEGGDLWVSVLLPCLVVGTVGGGTHLPAQRALLEMLGCTGPGSAQKLAELVASFCLALELSTAAAVASGAFAAAHDRLGRNRPVRPLTRADLGRSFFEENLRESLEDPSLAVREISWQRLSTDAAILSTLSKDDSERLLGLHRVVVRVVRGPERREEALPLVVKGKPSGNEVLHTMGCMAQACGRRLADAWRVHGRQTLFAGTHVRELGVYTQLDARFRERVPFVHHIRRDDERETYLLVLEDLSDAEVLDAVDDVRVWTPSRLEAVVKAMATLHAIWLGREEELRAQPWLGSAPDGRRMVELAELFAALAAHAAREHPDLMDAASLAAHERLITDIPEWWPQLEALPRTLVHGDFNPRNLALRRSSSAGCEVKAFDWELATLHVPQYDLAELLAHTLAPDVPAPIVFTLAELHRTELEAASGRTLDRQAWLEGLRLALRDFATNRLAFTLVAHTFRSYGFLPRVLRTTQRLRAILGDR